MAVLLLRASGKSQVMVLVRRVMRANTLSRPNAASPPALPLWRFSFGASPLVLPLWRFANAG